MTSRRNTIQKDLVEIPLRNEKQMANEVYEFIKHIQQLEKELYIEILIYW